MSRTLDRLPDGTYKEEIDDLNECRWMYDGICCNDQSEWVADFPWGDYCERCPLFEMERKMKVYISGKITGTSDFMEKFQRAEDKVRNMGYVPYNPAKANLMMPEEAEYDDYMAVSFALLDRCECIYMLSGWEDSHGANMEYKRAIDRKMIIFFERD